LPVLALKERRHDAGAWLEKGLRCTRQQGEAHNSSASLTIYLTHYYRIVDAGADGPGSGFSMRDLLAVSVEPGEEAFLDRPALDDAKHDFRFDRCGDVRANYLVTPFPTFPTFPFSISKALAMLALSHLRGSGLARARPARGFGRSDRHKR
jgi:hypothetical protein